MANYGKVLSYVKSCGFYQDATLRDWSNKNISDLWLIAVAIALNTTIITKESEIGTGLSTKNSSGNAKVPNPAKHFGIRL